MPKSWSRSLEKGICIPDDTQLKRFKADINLLKRKSPDKNYVMYPYNSKNECDWSGKTELSDEDIRYQNFVIEEVFFDDV